MDEYNRNNQNESNSSQYPTGTRRQQPPAFNVPSGNAQRPSSPYGGGMNGYASPQQSSSPASQAQGAPQQPRQPLKSPRTRPTISTNRVFSPYDLSFFEDPVTTRDLSDSEKARINGRNSSKGSQTSAYVGFSRTSGAPRSSSQTQRPASSSDFYSQPRQTASPAGASQRVLTPADNTFPEDRQASSQSGRMLTPDNNQFPEDARSVSARPASQQPTAARQSARVLTPADNQFPEDARTASNYGARPSQTASASRPAQAFSTPASAPTAARPAASAQMPSSAAASGTASRAARGQQTQVFTVPNTRPVNAQTPGSVPPSFNVPKAAQRPAASAQGTSYTQRTSTAAPAFNTQTSAAQRPAGTASTASQATGYTQRTGTVPPAFNTQMTSTQRPAFGASASSQTASYTQRTSTVPPSFNTQMTSTQRPSTDASSAPQGTSYTQRTGTVPPSFNTQMSSTQRPAAGASSAAQGASYTQRTSTVPPAFNTQSTSAQRPASSTAARRPASDETPAFNMSSSGTSSARAQGSTASFNSQSIRPFSYGSEPSASSSDTSLFTSGSTASYSTRKTSQPARPSGAASTIAHTAANAAGMTAAAVGTTAAMGAAAGAAGAAAATAFTASAAAGAAEKTTTLPIFSNTGTTRVSTAGTAKPSNTGFITGSLTTDADASAGHTVAISRDEVKSIDQNYTEPIEDEDYEADYEEEYEEEPPVQKTRKGKKQRRVETGTGGPNDPDDPDGTHAPKAEKPKRWFVILTAVLVAAVVLELIVGITGIVMINRMTGDSPDLNLTDFVGEESTKIYDDQGELVTEVGVYLRQNITYDKCPESLVDAFLSVEDSRFFSHFGFDIPRFTKAIIDNLKTMSFGQGGSTFTMQLVKNTYFSVESMDAEDTGTERTKSIEYKVQQIYLAIKLEHLLSKKEIFTLYLNKLNFGGNIRGVQRASQYYFGKNCNELNLTESAMLAGIVNLPNRYNPYDYLDYGTTRRNEVLQLMNYHGYLTDEELKLARAIKVEDTLVGDIREATEDSQYQSYIDVVLEEAMQLTGSDPTIKGMNIYTHLNRQMQEEVESIQNGESSVVYPDDLIQVAMISMDNRNGAIVAVGGGRNYDGARLLNRATMNYKQPGSSVKPLLSYALAFEYLGYSLEEVLLDKPITYPQESMVLVNASGNYAGDVTIKDAVGNSLNIPAIITLERVVNKIGPEKVVEYLQTIGFSRVRQENFHLSYAIGGTTFETTCKELAGAHAMLINKGVYNQPHTIEKVVMSADGSEYYSSNQNVRALSSGSAYLATELEANNVTGGYFNYMNILARSYPVYAKTGTTDWGTDGLQYGIPRGQMKDKWMVASTSQYTNCVWVGYDKAEAGKETYYTSYKSSLNIPGNINRLLLNKEEEIWGVPEAIPMPEDVVNVTYLYGTFPHVRAEFAMDGGGTVTSLVSSAGLESQPMVSVDEFLEYTASESDRFGTGGMSARFDQYNILTVSWGGSNGICSGGQRNISLHDPYNDIDQWGTCLADLSWLVGGGDYWGTVYIDDMPVGDISSSNGFFSGYVADLYGQVKVCGGSSTPDGSDNTACVVAQYFENPDAPSGYVDENGNWVEIVPDFNDYGYWDENGAWVGQGYWDDTGFHL